MSGVELPPPYYALKEEKEEATTEQQNFTEVPIPEPESQDVPEVYGPAFEHKDNRIGFIQKVLLIKMLQAFAATIVMVIFLVGGYTIYRAMVYDYGTRVHLIVISSLALVTLTGLLHYCNRARFMMPYNFMFLVAYPSIFGLFVSVVTYNWGLVEVFVSWVIFNFVLVVLLIYSILALQTKIEFKVNIGLMISGGSFIVTYALTVPFVYDMNAFGALYCSLMMFGLTAYVLNDLSAMMSKTYRLRLTPADFVKAAIIMHIDYRYMAMKWYNNHARPHLNAMRNNDTA